jgi:hypothetical protein
VSVELYPYQKKILEGLTTEEIRIFEPSGEQQIAQFQAPLKERW